MSFPPPNMNHLSRGSQASDGFMFEPTHAPEEAARWFDQWHLYRSIVDADWMGHACIFSAIRAWVLLCHPGPFRIMDLGCGDAGFIKPTFTNTGLWAYMGVDASPAALAKATEELTGASFQVRLLESDMLAYLQEAQDVAAKNFDIILASYAVHHLPSREKHLFFGLAQGHLAPGGTLLFADLFRHEGETREKYLERYVGMMQKSWTGLPPEALASTIEHVTQRDFPETPADLVAMAREAGFRQAPEELFRDATGFHQLVAFKTGTAG